MARRTIVVVDDHPIFRSGVVQVLELNDTIDVVAEGATVEDAVALAREHRPNMMLLDIAMGQRGVDAIPRVLAESPDTAVVMLSASEDVDDVSQSLELGAVSYILKGTSGNELLNIVDKVFAGQIHISPRVLGGLVSQQGGRVTTPERAALERLTKTEEKVLRHVSRGMSNSEVADRIGVQEKTIKFHLSNVFSKLAVRNRVEATLLAKKGWRD